MLVTATNELKFHQWPDEGVEDAYNLTISADIVSLSFSSDDNYMIYLQQGGKPEILNLRDIHNIKPIHVVTAIDKASVAVFQKGTKRYVAIGTDSATVALYDTKMKSIGKLLTLPSAVVGLDFNCTDDFLVVACVNGIISLYNVHTGIKEKTFDVEYHPMAATFHPTNPHIFGATTKEGTIHVFDIQKDKSIYHILAHCGHVPALAFIPQELTLLSGGQDCKLCVHDVAENGITFIGYLQYPLTCMDVSRDGKYLGIGTDEGSIYMYSTTSYKTPLCCWRPHDNKIRFLKFSNRFEGPDQNSHTSSNQAIHNKLRIENEFKSLYNKFLSKPDDGENLKLLRDDIIEDIKKDANQLHVQMDLHMQNLHNFIKKEFDKMALQMEDNWDILNMVSGTYKSAGDLTAEEKLLLDEDNPIVIE